MNELVFIQKEQALTTSLKVAEYFGKRHNHILRAVEGLINTEPKIGLSEYFMKSSYQDESGKKNLMYLMNRDGFSLLVMGFTGKKALTFKINYIQAFNAMEKLLLQRSTLDWQETRRLGKLTRRSETDVIQELVEYAKTQGSKNADKLYMVYSRLANKVAGITDGGRNGATIKQLNTCDEVESIIHHVIKLGIATGKHYKEIYQDGKRRLAMFEEITYRLTA